MTSDSAGTENKLSSRSTIDGLLQMGAFFLTTVLSPPKWRLKSNSRSIDDSSSVSLADDMLVHPVAELALLSEELGEWPNDRLNGNPGCISLDPLTEPHFLLIPFEA